MSITASLVTAAADGQKHQAMRDAETTVMSHEAKQIESETLHQLDLVEGHGPFGIRRMVGLVRRLACCHRIPLGRVR